jgi:GAF domain-containing protein
MALREHSMDKLLQTVAEVARGVLPGDSEVSVSLVADHWPSTVVFTARLALACDERQYRRGDGPCLHAASTGELVEIADMRAETRWRDYVVEAVDRGVGSSLSVPLVCGQPVTGALNVYAREPHAFDPQSRTVATRFAPYAAVALANMHAYQHARDMADNLEAALRSRAVIDQAKGILMERHKLTANQAFEVLALRSVRTHTTVRDVAERLVDTGELPRR